MNEWRVLESRAILEVVKGRLEIIDKFQVMLVNDVRETAHEIGDDNMHDLLGRFPWLLNPEWQVLAEEQSLTKQLQEWGTKDIGKDDRSRYDFLALENDRTLVVPRDQTALPRDQPWTTLPASRSTGSGWRPRAPVRRYTWCSSTAAAGTLLKRSTTPGCRRRTAIFGLGRSSLSGAANTTSGTSLSSKPMFEPPDFARLEAEVQDTRSVMNSGSVYRGVAKRTKGLGPQDTRPPEDFRPTPHQ